eukprot:6194167-Pleurochrysis_carterae.AAC.5
MAPYSVLKNAQALPHLNMWLRSTSPDFWRKEAPTRMPFANHGLYCVASTNPCASTPYKGRAPLRLQCRTGVGLSAFARGSVLAVLTTGRIEQSIHKISLLCKFHDILFPIISCVIRQLRVEPLHRPSSAKAILTTFIMLQARSV